MLLKVTADIHVRSFVCAFVRVHKLAYKGATYCTCERATFTACLKYEDRQIANRSHSRTTKTFQ